MAVHAHPDDEASSTGGILARYADEGVRTVVVTCTNGELGDGPGGVKPGEPGHDEAQVVAMRRAELESSCKILGVAALELLGFHDSGMMGWPQNSAPGAFWNTPVDEAAARLAVLMERYRPDVVVTYDANGFYGHPDHIQAHRVAVAATERTGIPAKLYFSAVPRSAMQGFAERLREAGVEPPDLGGGGDGGDGQHEPPPDIGTPDELIDAVIDVGSAVDRKWDALGAHASQTDNTFFLRMGKENFRTMFDREAFVRFYDRTGVPTPEEDLFAGLR